MRSAGTAGTAVSRFDATWQATGFGPVIPTKVDQELLPTFAHLATRCESPGAHDPEMMMIATLLLRP